MPLKKANTEHWKDYVLLKKCWSEAVSITMNKQYARMAKGQYGLTHQLGHEIFNEVVECANKNFVKYSIIQALETLRDHAANYGASYSFEISPRNVGTDEHGNLILVDVIYDMEKNIRRRRS